MRRRSAKEWAQLIRELERSGADATAFARSRGIRPDTLKWWRWRLRSSRKSSSPAQPDSKQIRLLAVEPVQDSAPHDRAIATPIWELVAPSGHELRVYDRRGLSVLRAALFAVAGRRR